MHLWDFVVFAEWRVIMNKGDNVVLNAQYYQDKIIEIISKCEDVKVLHYLEKFNRLWIEKYAKEKE